MHEHLDVVNESAPTIDGVDYTNCEISEESKRDLDDLRLVAREAKAEQQRKRYSDRGGKSVFLFKRRERCDYDTRKKEEPRHGSSIGDYLTNHYSSYSVFPLFSRCRSIL